MSEYYRLHVQLNKDDPQDAVVIQALERLGERGKSRWVKHTLYAAVTGPMHNELLNEIRAVRDAVERLETNGIAVAAKPDATTAAGEPAKARAGLDAMKKRFKGG